MSRGWSAPTADYGTDAPGSCSIFGSYHNRRCDEEIWVRADLRAVAEKRAAKKSGTWPEMFGWPGW